MGKFFVAVPLGFLTITEGQTVSSEYAVVIIAMLILVSAGVLYPVHAIVYGAMHIGRDKTHVVGHTKIFWWSTVIVFPTVLGYAYGIGLTNIGAHSIIIGVLAFVSLPFALYADYKSTPSE